MKITEDIIYVGVNDHDVDLFEGQYIVPNGMAYNSYVIRDEKIAVMDTVDCRFAEEWLANIEKALDGATPDYLIVQHMEPDHAANIQVFAEKYPSAQIVGNAKTFTMMKNFFHGLELDGKTVEVKNGETLNLGKHELTFVFAPMVHWPEVMVTYDSSDKVLFSADGFGKFGALDTEEPWDEEARRYYYNIVGKYGAPVQALLKKAAKLNIAKICPLHGPVLTEDLGHYLEKYNLWSTYQPEEHGVLIAHASIHGNTAKAAELLADLLLREGETVAVVDLARDDMAEAVANAFQYDRMVLAAASYDGGLFPPMEEFLLHLKAKSFQNRTVALIENGSWAPCAKKCMANVLNEMKKITVLEQTVTIRSTVKPETESQLQALAEAIRKA